MKIYCLIENNALSGEFLCEHDLSLFIDTGKHKILFDMGQSDAYIENARRLGLDLSSVDIAILSHGHYDHGGGIKSFLEINTTASIYMSKHAFEPHYNGKRKYIGLDTALMDSSRIIFTDNTVSIDTGITVFNCNDKKPLYDFGTFGQTVLKNDEYISEDFCHEQYLLITENDKKILFSGCSHKGILNIASWIEADIIVGGFHFSKMELGSELKDYADTLGKFKADFYTCHCTGHEQYEFMKQFAKNIKYISSGDVIEI